MREDRNAGAGERSHIFGKLGCGIELQHIRAAFLHQLDGRAHEIAEAFVQWAEGDVADQQRTLGAAPHRLAADQDFFDRHLQWVVVTEQVHAHRIADDHKIRASTLRDQRRLIIPQHEAGALLALPLHLLEHRDGHGFVGRHGNLSFSTWNCTIGGQNGAWLISDCASI